MYTYIFIHVYICINKCMYLYVCTYICVCVCEEVRHIAVQVYDKGNRAHG